MIKFLQNILTTICLIFKKSLQGVATSTELTVIPSTKQEIENVVVKEQEDNYQKITMEKSFLQYKYEQVVKELDIVENPFIDFEKVGPGYKKCLLQESKIEWKEDVILTEEQEKARGKWKESIELLRKEGLKINEIKQEK